MTNIELQHWRTTQTVHKVRSTNDVFEPFYSINLQIPRQAHSNHRQPLNSHTCNRTLSVGLLYKYYSRLYSSLFRFQSRQLTSVFNYQINADVRTKRGNTPRNAGPEEIFNQISPTSFYFIFQWHSL